MTEKKYLYALSGLVADPLLYEQKEILIPSQWLQAVLTARPAALQASQLVAGARQDARPGDLKQPLLSVFSSITTGEGAIPAKVYWPKAVLELKESKESKESVVMPKETVPATSAPWEKFLEKAGALKQVYENAPDENLPDFIENLLYLMQLYAWCLPCSYQASLPDVSLYDHSRMSAALAAALSERKEGDAALAQLVGGDISGVQQFIYTITARGAASSLRGRSFYLQLLTEAAARYVLRQLGLPVTSLVYAGGGNFYILAPASAELAPASQHISRVLLQNHPGELALATASQPLQEKDFFDGEISGRWQDLSEALNRAKLRSFSGLGDELKSLFRPQGMGGDEKTACQVCGAEMPEPATEQPRKCQPCQSYEELGKDLRQARFLSYRVFNETTSKERSPARGWEKTIAQLGLEIKSHHDVGDLPKSNGQKVILALDDDAYVLLAPARGLAVGRRFMVNVTPTVTQDDIRAMRGKLDEMPFPDTVKPFDMLEKQSKGIERLGVLRMDVDNLSAIFRSGFGKSATLSRVGALSFAVSLYFEGWVGKLAEDANQRDKAAGWGERLYSIYSGGDDLFFVGAWDAVVELARQIRADLGRYAGQHPGIHASAGLALVGGKYPLYQAAQDAGQAEEQAKALEWFDAAGKLQKKDAISFLGQAVSWKQFGLEKCTDTGQQTVHAWMHRLETALSADGTPRALLGLLIGLQEKYDKVAREKERQGTDLNQQRQKQAIWGPWNWLSAYYLKRMQKRSQDQDFKDMLEGILKLLQSDQFASIEWIGLAARWAELKLRQSHSR